MITLDISILAKLAQKPALFAGGEKLWDDPYIATQMLKAHLDPLDDAASRKPETIDRCVDWIIQRLELPMQSEIIDLGCGPGLYTERLCRRGLRVTGMDFSANSITYATKSARAEGLAIDYRLQNYLQLAEREKYDTALLIYYDLGPLSNTDRDTLLANVWLALKPGGRFVFDVLTAQNWLFPLPEPTWSVHPKGGFWRPRPYLVLGQVFHYPEAHAFLDQYIILEEGQKPAVYRNWNCYYSPETIRLVLERAGFIVDEVLADLTGTPYKDDSPSIGVIARKM